MIFTIAADGEQPIYAQIGDRVKFAVASGLLRPGEMVPSVRELSRQLLVNPNTVARAYRDLQLERILDPIRGTGLQVSQEAPEACRRDRRAFVQRKLREAIAEAKASGLPADEVEQIWSTEWEAARLASTSAEGNGNGNGDGKGARRG